MCTESSGGWLTTKDKPTSKPQTKAVGRKPRTKAVTFKHDHIATVHLSFSSSPPTPLTKQALEKKKQSKLDAFFKPVQNKQMEDLCKDKQQAEDSLARENRLSRKRQHLRDSPEQDCDLAPGLLSRSAEGSENNDCDELEDTPNSGDDRCNISGIAMFDDTTVESEENTSSPDDEIEFSPVIHINSQVKSRLSPLSKRLKTSNDLEELLNSQSASLEEHNGCTLQTLSGDKENCRDQTLCGTQTKENRNSAVDQGVTDVATESLTEGLTPQEFSEIPPFTFNQKPRMSHSIDFAENLAVQIPNSRRKNYLDNNSNGLLTSTNSCTNDDLNTLGVETESIGYTQWVHKQGEKCKRIQNEAQLLETPDVIVSRRRDQEQVAEQC